MNLLRQWNKCLHKKILWSWQEKLYQQFSERHIITKHSRCKGNRAENLKIIQIDLVLSPILSHYSLEHTCLESSLGYFRVSCIPLYLLYIYFVLFLHHAGISTYYDYLFSNYSWKSVRISLLWIPKVHAELRTLASHCLGVSTLVVI